MFNRFLCKHSWFTIRKVGIWFDGIYGCKKCGKVKEIQWSKHSRWRFKREMKGELFDE